MQRVLRADAVGVIPLLVIVFVVVVGPLAALYGADSRIDEPRR